MHVSVRARSALRKITGSSKSAVAGITVSAAFITLGLGCITAGLALGSHKTAEDGGVWLFLGILAALQFWWGHRAGTHVRRMRVEEQLDDVIGAVDEVRKIMLARRPAGRPELVVHEGGKEA